MLEGFEMTNLISSDLFWISNKFDLKDFCAAFRPRHVALQTKEMEAGY